MPRPKKGRYVECLPAVAAFRPVDAVASAGSPRSEGVDEPGGKPTEDEVVLTVEEFEAIRLRDMEGLDQDVCAARMQISRQTFQRILASARRKLACMLTRGLALRIAGGEFRLGPGHYRCPQCHREFDINAQGYQHGCPHCSGRRARAATPEDCARRAADRCERAE